jgi:hypothetical protein
MMIQNASIILPISLLQSIAGKVYFVPLKRVRRRTKFSVDETAWGRLAGIKNQEFVFASFFLG